MKCGTDHEKKLMKYLDVSEDKFSKMKEKFEKASSQVTTLRLKNEALNFDISLKKAEADLKKEAMKREINQLEIERESRRADEKIRANQQKSDLALKHMHARLADVQAKKEDAAALKEK